jgi:serine/threonine-protein kinase
MGTDERVGHFRLLSRLGAGGMGVVYRARDEKLDRDVAVKLIHANRSWDESFRRRLLREAKAAAAVSHPGVATIYEIGEDGDQLFIVMELLSGETLRKSIGTLSVKRALEIGAAIADALAKAHEAGIVHRDVKPENVLITNAGVVKVLDFGIARRETAEPANPDAATEAALSQEGSVIGTPGYMSPEQALGKPVGAASDVFSLGIILYEMLAHALPFPADSLMDAAVRVTRDEPEPLAERASLPIELAALVHSCLAKDAGARPSSAELAARLRQMADDLSGVTAPTFVGSHAPVLAAPGARGRRRAWIAVPVVAAIGLGGWLATRNPRPNPTPPAASVAAPSATTIVDLEITGTTNQEAKKSYQSALLETRRGDWQKALAHLRQTCAKDPSFVLGKLRLAYVEGSLDSVEARKLLRWVAEREGELSERNRAFLHIVEAQYADPPDYRLAATRLEDAGRRWPQDAELACMLGYTRERARYLGDPIEPAKRAVEIDPTYSDALQILGRAMRRRGDVAEALKYIDRCIEARGVDCLFERVRTRAFAGHCSGVIADSKAMEASGARGSVPWLFAASALLTQGESVEAAESFLSRAEAQADGVWARWVARSARLRLKLLLGQFELMERDVVPSSSQLTDLESLADLTVLGVEAMLEAGKPDVAATLAERYLTRRHAVPTRLGILGRAEDQSPVFWDFLVRAGRLSTSERDEKLARWTKSQAEVGVNSGLTWFLSRALTARTKEDAKQALATMPAKFTAEEVQEERLGWDVLGRLYRLNGEHDKALAQLKKATESCTLLLLPTAHLRAQAELAETHEALKDVTRACAAYKEILRWWGKARPRSVTADRARQRMAALRCSK